MSPAVVAGLLLASCWLLARPARGPGHRRLGAALGRRRPGPPRLTRWRRTVIATRAPTPGDFSADHVALLAERLAALYRAGLPPGRVWAVLGEDVRWVGLCRLVGRTTALGGPVAEALRSAAPSGGPLACLALAFAVSHAAGAPIADVLQGLAEALRAEADGERDQEAALAGPRATAAILTWLPLAGLGLALLAGTNPLVVLFATAPGRACLITGGIAWLAGRRWLARLVRRASRPALVADAAGR